MSEINKWLIWLEDKDLKILLEFIKLQAQVFALEENLNINYFELVTNIFKKNKRK